MPPRKETRGRKPKDGDMTIREQKFLDLIVNKGYTGTAAYKKLYPHKTDNQAAVSACLLRKKIRTKDGYRRIMEAAGITEEFLAKKHKELLDASRPVYSGEDKEGKREKIGEIPDYQTQMQALKHANELLDNIPSKKNEITGANGGPIEATVILVDKDEDEEV